MPIGRATWLGAAGIAAAVTAGLDEDCCRNGCPTRWPVPWRDGMLDA